MPSLPILLAALAGGALLLANLGASRRLGREPGLPPGQRRAQHLVIWLLPVVGALLVWWLSRPEPPPPPAPANGSPEENDEDLAICHTDYHHSD